MTYRLSCTQLDLKLFFMCGRDEWFVISLHCLPSGEDIHIDNETIRAFLMYGRSCWRLSAIQPKLTQSTEQKLLQMPQRNTETVERESPSVVNAPYQRRQRNLMTLPWKLILLIWTPQVFSWIGLKSIFLHLSHVMHCTPSTLVGLKAQILWL